MPRAQSRRLTVRVPAADTSTTAWWDAQDDPGASVRSLIRAEIVAHGLSDTMNRPVTPGVLAGATASPAGPDPQISTTKKDQR